MLTANINPSTDLNQACNRFFHEIRDWIEQCIADYGSLPPSDVHDQGTYTTGWTPYIEVTGDEEALTFMTTLRDRIRDHYVASGQWRHGYWLMQEAHHGTEHFELFLGSLLRLAPADPVTTEQLLDAAEHLGNWAPEIPPWFDWESGLFRSFFFGADGIGDRPGAAVNRPDHLRCVNICLLAYQASGEARFLELATAHAGRWAAAIRDGAELPIVLRPEGPLYQISAESEALYRSFVGQASTPQAAVDRAESFLASDGINTFLTLDHLTGQADFRRAAEHLLTALVPELGDPDAGPVADAIRSYRLRTGDTRYDRFIQATAAILDPFAIETVSLDTDFHLERRPSGIGKRSDMPRWFENGLPRRHNPITLAVAAEISQNVALATRAVDLARTYFILAREIFPHGRDHGCAARTVSAVARGHGRDNHAGMTTAVLAPLYRAFIAP